MRILTLLPFALLLGGCLAPGQRNPTRYPWDRRNLAALPHPPLVARGGLPPVAAPRQKFVPPEGSYCVIALEPRAQGLNGVIVGGKAPGILSCSVPPVPPAPKSHN